MTETSALCYAVAKTIDDDTNDSVALVRVLISFSRSAGLVTPRVLANDSMQASELGCALIRHCRDAGAQTLEIAAVFSSSENISVDWHSSRLRT